MPKGCAGSRRSARRPSIGRRAEVSTIRPEGVVRAYGNGTGYGYADRDDMSIHLSEWDEHDPKRVR